MKRILFIWICVIFASNQVAAQKIALTNRFFFKDTATAPADITKMYTTLPTTSEYHTSLITEVLTAVGSENDSTKILASYEVDYALVGLGPTKREVVLYNPNDLSETSSYFGNLAIISHEIGHIFKRHLYIENMNSINPNIELEADYYAGFIPSLLGLTNFEDALEPFKNFIESPKYFNFETRSKKIINGFSESRKILGKSVESILINSGYEESISKNIRDVINQNPSKINESMKTVTPFSVTQSYLPEDINKSNPDTIPIIPKTEIPVISKDSTQTYLPENTLQRSDDTTGYDYLRRYSGASIEALETMVSAFSVHSIPLKVENLALLEKENRTNYKKHALKLSDLMANNINIFHSVSLSNPDQDFTSSKYRITTAPKPNNSGINNIIAINHIKQITYQVINTDPFKKSSSQSKIVVKNKKNSVSDLKFIIYTDKSFVLKSIIEFDDASQITIFKNINL